MRPAGAASASAQQWQTHTAVSSGLQPVHAPIKIGNSPWGSARAGDYRLSVANAKTKERLPGSPFALAVRAATADAARSSAAFIDGAKPIKGGAAGAAGAAEAAAGVPVTLAVTLRDRFGNLAPGAPVTGQQSSRPKTCQADSAAPLFCSATPCCNSRACPSC